MYTPASIQAGTLKPMLTDGGEIAFVDVREPGQYGEGHPFFAVNIPYSVLEARAGILLPCRSVRCVLLDAGDGTAAKAARVLGGLGYTGLRILEGGAAAWAAAGFTLFRGVNLPSKAFGERVAHDLGTPSIAAEDLRRLQAQGQPVAVLDGRTPGEFRKMSVPGARSCPNAELGYRLRQIVPDPDTPVIINCAGRTRSIIGAQTLRELGVSNPVMALRNGTQGWRLAGFPLDHGRPPEALPAPPAVALAATRRQAARLIGDFGLATVDYDTLRTWQADPGRTTCLFDVRTRAEYEQGHLAGARHAPGGQLVQATDAYIAVRGARIVLSDDTRLRAATTALWLTGMGHRVWILDADASKGGVTQPADGTPEEAASTIADTIRLADVPAALRSGAVLLDASRGMDYRAAHVEGARWVTRARLDRVAVSRQTPVIVTGRSRVLLAGVVRDLGAMGYRRLACVQGTPDSWRAAGLTLTRTLDIPDEADCIDYLFFVHDRHDGNLEAARHYLAWECGLLDRLDPQESAVLDPRRARRAESA